MFTKVLKWVGASIIFFDKCTICCVFLLPTYKLRGTLSGY